MDPNTLLFGVLGVALGFLALWISTFRYRAKARSEASSIVELARKEASVDRKQQLAEADLEIKKLRQELEQEILSLRSDLSQREKEVAEKEQSAAILKENLQQRLNEVSSGEKLLAEQNALIATQSSSYRLKLE